MRVGGTILLGAIAAFGGDAAAQDRVAAIYLSPEEARADWHAGWSDARRAGDLIFVSGVVVAPTPADGGDLDPAFNRAFDRIAATLTLAGADLDDVVDLTAYLTDVERQTPALDRVRLGRMRPPYAASTVVEVRRLIPPQAIGEIRVVARTDGETR